MSEKYEYFDYIQHFNGGGAYLNDYTENGARVKFWQESHMRILLF